MVISQERFRDEELLEPRAVLEQKGADVYIAAGQKAAANGMFGAKVNPDYSLQEALPKEFDAVLVVGGQGTPTHIWGNQTVIDIVKKQHAAGRTVGAICLAPVVLAQAGLLNGLKATLYKSPDSVAEFNRCGVITVDEDVVVSGSIVTGNGPAAAKKFGEKVAELLFKE